MGGRTNSVCIGSCDDFLNEKLFKNKVFHEEFTFMGYLGAQCPRLNGTRRKTRCKFIVEVWLAIMTIIYHKDHRSGGLGGAPNLICIKQVLAKFWKSLGKLSY